MLFADVLLQGESNSEPHIKSSKVGFEFPCQYFERSGFANPVRAYQPQYLPWPGNWQSAQNSKVNTGWKPLVATLFVLLRSDMSCSTAYKKV